MVRRLSNCRGAAIASGVLPSAKLHAWMHAEYARLRATLINLTPPFMAQSALPYVFAHFIAQIPH
jgi:hypothetical protein